MSGVDDKHDKLAHDLGTSFHRPKTEVTELYLFHCGACGYKNIHDRRNLLCGCGASLAGRLVYRKVDGVVIFDSRENTRSRKRH